MARRPPGRLAHPVATDEDINVLIETFHKIYSPEKVEEILQIKKSLDNVSLSAQDKIKILVNRAAHIKDTF